MNQLLIDTIFTAPLTSIPLVFQNELLNKREHQPVEPIVAKPHLNLRI